MKNNIETLKQYFGCYKEHNLEKFVSFLAPGFTHQSSLTQGQPLNKEYMAKGFTVFIDACPDIDEVIVSAMAEGDRVVCEVLETGTFTQPMNLKPGVIVQPTNKPYKLPFAAFYRFNPEGLITEQHVYLDTAELAKQLGIDMSVFTPEASASAKKPTLKPTT